MGLRGERYRRQMSDAIAERVSVTLEDGIVSVRLTRPEKRNALDPAMMEALIAAGEQVKAMPGARAVVLSGDGASFCAGLDLGRHAVAGRRRRRRPPGVHPGGGPRGRDHAPRAAGVLGLAAGRRSRRRGRARSRARRRPATGAGRGHPRHPPGCAAQPARDPLGAGAGRDGQPDAGSPGAARHPQGPHVQRPDLQRARGRRPRRGHRGVGHAAQGRRRRWPAATPSAARRP